MKCLPGHVISFVNQEQEKWRPCIFMTGLLIFFTVADNLWLEFKIKVFKT